MRGDCIRIFEGHKDFVLSVALSPDGKWVMSGSKDRGVQFWDPETGDAQLMLQGHKNSGESLLMIFTFIFLIASMSFSC
jgi:glucose repression regulatory protein TUP1